MDGVQTIGRSMCVYVSGAVEYDGGDGDAIRSRNCRGCPARCNIEAKGAGACGMVFSHRYSQFLLLPFIRTKCLFCFCCHHQFDAVASSDTASMCAGGNRRRNSPLCHSPTSGDGAHIRVRGGRPRKSESHGRRQRAKVRSGQLQERLFSLLCRCEQ